MARALRFILIVSILATVVPAVAVAEKRVAVSPFRGDDSAAHAIERDVMAILRREARLVEADTDGVDGVIFGTVTRRRANVFMLHLLVVEKASGKRFEEIAIRLAEPHLRGDVRREVTRQLREYIAEIVAVPQDEVSGAETRDSRRTSRQRADRGPARRVSPGKDLEGYETLSEGEPLEEELFQDERRSRKNLASSDADEDGDGDEDGDDRASDVAGDEDEDSFDDDRGSDDDSEDGDRLGIESRQVSGSRLSTMPMEIIAGLNVIERTVLGNGDTAVSDIFARADVYPFTARKNLLRHLGGVVEVGRPVGGGGAGGADAGGVPMTPGMDLATGVPTQLVAGAATRYRYKRNLFVVLAKADAGLRVTAGGGQSDLGAIVRGTVAAGAEVKTFLFLAEAANFMATGNSQSDQFNIVPNLIVDWRLRHGGIHPFVIAVLPLHKDVRENAPLILQLGVRYEQ